MPILPLDHPEPFAATLGVMLYPATDSADTARARAFASQMLAEPIRQFHEAGYILSYDTLERIAIDAGQPLIDLDERWEGGLATGDLFKTLYTLAKTIPRSPPGKTQSRSTKLARSALAPRAPARLCCEREIASYRSLTFGVPGQSAKGGSLQHPEVGYDGYADFQVLSDRGRNPS